MWSSVRKIGLWSNKLKECLISLLKSHNLGLLEFKVILAKKVGEQGKKIKISLLRKQGMQSVVIRSNVRSLVEMLWEGNSVHFIAL